jgi:hypothetical protein
MMMHRRDPEGILPFVISVAALGASAGALVVALSGCPKPHVPDPRPELDGAAPATCEVVCAHWTDMGCEEAEPTPAGGSCVDVCKNIQDGTLKEDLECQAAVTSCDQIDSC